MKNRHIAGVSFEIQIGVLIKIWDREHSRKLSSYHFNSLINVQQFYNVKMEWSI